MSIAWYIQRIISTVQSAINGGLMFSRAAMRFASKKGLVHIDPDDSFLDEIVGWTLALGGAYFQVSPRASSLLAVRAPPAISRFLCARRLPLGGTFHSQ
jgi:hypothetical protein